MNLYETLSLSWLSFKWLWTWTRHVNVRVDMDVDVGVEVEPLTMPRTGPIQAKAARQQKQFKCYCTFRLHVLAAAAAAAPIQCLIFRAVVFTPPSHSPFSSSFYTFFILVIVCVFLLACRASCELKTKVGEILSPSALSVKITLQVGATSIPLPPLLPLLHSLPAK